MAFSGVLSPCIVCHNHGDYMRKNKLLEIERLCSPFEAEHEFESNVYTVLRTHSKCRYGLRCPELDRFDNECNAIARCISGKIVTAVVTGDNKVYHRLIELCRGDFPAAYHYLERIRCGNEK